MTRPSPVMTFKPGFGTQGLIWFLQLVMSYISSLALPRHATRCPDAEPLVLTSGINLLAIIYELCMKCDGTVSNQSYHHGLNPDQLLKSGCSCDVSFDECDSYTPTADTSICGMSLPCSCLTGT
ncbi:uncharacterized protein BO97DRAFT_174227 [Aspergillus homomorphus CBS 101889]|uniref:Uncharacterized protein n=1 Tax=Aspergillus homomorphus (strain CBS 101889) TaxID=1450537 RepID=A0A395I768_ASPHC|nr:hypothetical protein BO97DRAFT_174227 [Aspergillus homomorphus CBS 101889]RAL15746.1 hypothetical protein BO97DRAFT_174227 [Aspergillus homomorphus CBS 101889]